MGRLWPSPLFPSRLKCVGQPVLVADGPHVDRPNRAAETQEAHAAVHKTEIRSPSAVVPAGVGMAAMLDAVRVVAAFAFPIVHVIIRGAAVTVAAGQILLFAKYNCV